MNVIATAIAAAVEQQGCATEEISRSIQQASFGNQVVQSLMGKVRESAESGRRMALDVSDSSQDLSNQMHDLQMSTGKFLSTLRSTK